MSAATAVLCGLLQLAAAELPRTQHFTLHSQHAKRDFYISVALPDEYATNPTGRFPVLYALDPYLHFGTVAETAHLLEMNHRIPGVIVVAIGFDANPTTPQFQRTRITMLTPTSNDADIVDKLGARYKGVPSGQGPATLSFIRDELIPDIDKRYRTTAERGLFGHSLGGLFTSYALAVSPATFQSYLISSPATWWDNGWILRQGFARAASTKARVFISNGRDEETDMIAYADSVADALRAPNLAANVEVRRVMFEEEEHLSVVPAALAKGIRWLFAPRK